jgi:hypothetical protein
MTAYRMLQIALALFGVVFCLIWPLSIVWPAGWSWHDGPPNASHYFMMIVGIYAALGVFLILAARDPLANRSLIHFTIISSVVHAAIMAVQSIRDPAHGGHLLGDVPALFPVTLVLGILLPLAERDGGEEVTRTA